MSPSPELAAQAFVFGYPLVYNVTALQAISAQGMSTMPPAPFNRFAFARELASPDTPFVSVNNDTLYLTAQLDLSGGPVELDVPDTAGRYYVLQFVDAWTNNVAYVGRRATGTAAGAYLIVPPGWNGDAGERTVIASPTAIATIVGRIACAGPDDVAAATALQDRFVLREAPGNGPLRGLAAPDPSLPEPLRFWDALRLWSQALPPAASDAAYLASFASLGLTAAEPPYADADPELAEALTAGLAAGREQVERAATATGGAADTGWQTNLHAFDYNRDFFGVGAQDDPRWRIADAEQAYRARAVAARMGLWGNHGYEAVYPTTFVDADGAPLDGRHRYEISFAAPPPVDAFWSMTMYALPEFYLVANPIDRYSIGDRTPGTVTADDGSLTVYLQTDEPDDPVARANWLPTPPGRFRPMIRLYQPRDEVLAGRYALPPIRRTGG